MLYTLKDLTDFCWENKKHRAFKDHSYEQIGERIIWAVERNKLYYSEDSSGVCGLAIVTQKPAKKLLYIHYIVCKRSGLARLVKYALEKFPDYKIQGLRSSKLITFERKYLCLMILQAREKTQKAS